jgi:PAS domain S-box-containing protein
MLTSNPFKTLRRTPILDLLQGQREPLAQIAAGTPLFEVLKGLAAKVEARLHGPGQVSVLLADNDGKRLLLGAAPTLPSSYTDAIDGLEIGPGSACGTAAWKGEPVFTADVATDALWANHRELALRHGLKACWSIPIVNAEEKVVGTFAVYFPEPKAPTSEDIEVLAVAAQTITLVIERAALMRATQSAEDRHRQIVDSATDFAIISTDLQGRVTSWNKGAERIMGWSEDEILGQMIHAIFRPEDVRSKRPEAEMQGALSQGFAPDERWHLRKSGELFWAVGQLTPLKSDNGEVIGFVKVLRDRSKQKYDDERLEKLTRQLDVEVAERTRERDRIWRNSMDLLLEIGPDGVLRAVNPAWSSTLGYEASDLVDHYFEPFVHPKDVAGTVAAITQASQGPLDHFEVRIRHKDGSYRWFAWRAAPENGMVYANGRDITVEKQQAEQIQQANEARLQLALDVGQMGVWEWSVHSGEIIWLHGAAQVHGQPAANAPAVIPVSDYFKYVHPADRQMFAQVFERARENTRHQQAEYRVVWPDGSIHWVEARGRMLSSEPGMASHMVGVSVDITQRKRAEQDLKFLAQASSELAGLTDPRSTLDRLAYLAVPTFADWCAVDLLQEDGSLKRVAVAHADPQKVLLAHELHRRFPPDPNLPHGVWQVLRTGRPEFIDQITDDMVKQAIAGPERRAVMKELGFRSYIGVPLSVQGKTLGAVLFFSAESGRCYNAEDMALAEDLAHRAAVAMENAELYRALQSADQAKNVFLATLSHELRNPLAAIVSGIGLLTLAIDDKKLIEQYTKLIDRQANQLAHLVDGLMDLSRITTGKIELQKEATSLAGILNNAIESSRPSIEAGQHKLSVSMPDESTYLSADPVRLAQVFSNLLTNAAKYTPEGGEIQVFLECSPDEYVVRIRDNGIGIAPDMRKNIFKIFTQVKHPIQRSQGGLGIGLSLVEGLVNMHGGRIEAVSAGENRGSEFVVHLPRPENQVSVEDASSKLASGNLHEAPEKRRVLVVDDNIDAATAAADIISIFGHEVKMAHDGLSAVAVAREMKPDIILLDIGLPGIDGYEVARRIRALPDIRRTTLIAVTGWGQEQDKQHAYQAGFDHHFTKPIKLHQLTEILI